MGIRVKFKFANISLLHRVPRMGKICPRCHGDGTITCPRCGGAGEIMGVLQNYTCKRCDGQGEVRCPRCDGQGEI